MSTPEDQSARLEALERQVASLAAEVAQLRGTPAGPPRAATPEMDRMIGAAERFYTRATRTAAVSVSGDEIESFVGRYGTLLFAAAVILMAVGVLVEVAVSYGLLTATVRVALGALAAALVGGAGLWFRRRGEVRYGDVLLALALAILDLVAWGAGPRLHLVPSLVALLVVDLVAIGIATLALYDENEFLFAVAVGGALSAPFVTSSEPGTASVLLAYGATVIVGSLRAVRQPSWIRAGALLVIGAAAYALFAGALPIEAEWYAPYLVVLFAGACALGALGLAPAEWRGNLSRALLAVGLIGVPLAWDHAGATAFLTVAAIAAALASVTYAALAHRSPSAPRWTESALVLPLLSLGIAYPVGEIRERGWVALIIWTLLALGAWRFERARAEEERGGAHLLAGGLLGALAIAAFAWDRPLLLVAGLSAWGVALAWAAAREISPLPIVSVAAVLGGAALSAIDQLASRAAYTFTPLMTRSSASALFATAGLALASELLGREEAGERGGGIRRWANRPLRLGIVIGFAILWGRMEVAHAFNRDVATFLLTLYYAACGLATILAGRRLGVQRLRMVGLAMAIYAAVKAMVEATGIDDVALRVGSYGAVGLFLLGAGYLYRARREAASGGAQATVAD